MSPSRLGIRKLVDRRQSSARNEDWVHAPQSSGAFRRNPCPVSRNPLWRGCGRHEQQPVGGSLHRFRNRCRLRPDTPTHTELTRPIIDGCGSPHPDPTDHTRAHPPGRYTTSKHKARNACTQLRTRAEAPQSSQGAFCASTPQPERHVAKEPQRSRQQASNTDTMEDHSRDLAAVGPDQRQHKPSQPPRGGSRTPPPWPHLPHTARTSTA